MTRKLFRTRTPRSLSEVFVRSMLVAFVLPLAVLFAAQFEHHRTDPSQETRVETTSTLEYRDAGWWNGSVRVPLDCPFEDSCAVQDNGSYVWVFQTS